MPEKRMMILPAELVKKINDNRGDLSQAEFINFLLEDRLEEKFKDNKEITREEFESLKKEIKQILLREAADKERYATKEEQQLFQEDTKKLIKSFLDFSIGYGLEMGKKSGGNDLKELVKKLDTLEGDLPADEEGGEVKIKWK
ncbi:MAG TPA: hypothetical protein G4O19_02615 [Dehalococcoidia bacterium]|nr:hypothetical protein [Dehalococcoidia bacterium]